MYYSHIHCTVHRCIDMMVPIYIIRSCLLLCTLGQKVHVERQAPKKAKDTVNFGIVKEWTRLCLVRVQEVGLGRPVIGEYEVTPRIKLFPSRVGVWLYGEERREIVLPWPLETGWERHGSDN